MTIINLKVAKLTGPKVCFSFILGLQINVVRIITYVTSNTSIKLPLFDYKCITIILISYFQTLQRITILNTTYSVF